MSAFASSRLLHSPLGTHVAPEAEPHAADRLFEPDDLRRRLELYQLEEAATEVNSRQEARRVSPTLVDNPRRSSFSRLASLPLCVQYHTKIDGLCQSKSSQTLTPSGAVLTASYSAFTSPHYHPSAAPIRAIALHSRTQCKGVRKNSRTGASAGVSSSPESTPPPRGTADAPHCLQLGSPRARLFMVKAGSYPLSHTERETLQRVGEQSSLGSTPPEWNGISATVTNNTTTRSTPEAYTIDLSDAHDGISETAPSPTTALGSHMKIQAEKGHLELRTQAQPAIMVTKADKPQLRRSSTDPRNWIDGNGQGAHAGSDASAHKADRLSVGSAMRSSSERDQTKADVMRKRNTIGGATFIPRGRQQPGTSLKPSIKGKEPVRDVNQANGQAMSQLNGNSVLRRERELRWREQAVREAQVRREKEGRTLHPVSRPQIARPSPAHVVSRNGQLLQNSRTVGNADRRTTPALRPSGVPVNEVNAQLLKNGSTKTTNINLRRASLGSHPPTPVPKGGDGPSLPKSNNERPTSAQAKRQARVLSQSSPMPLLLNSPTTSPTSMGFKNGKSPTQYKFPRPPSGSMPERPAIKPTTRDKSSQQTPTKTKRRSLPANVLHRDPSTTTLKERRHTLSQHPTSTTNLLDRHSRSPNPTNTATVRTSSAHSTSSYTSRPSSRNSRTSRTPHPNKTHRSQRGVTKEHMDALAALTAPAPPPTAQMTPESIAFFQQQQSRLREKLHRDSVASERAMRISYHAEANRSRTSLHSTATTEASRPGSRINGQFPNGSESDLGTLSPESIRLLREREKLLRWKAEREKGEFEKRERERIRERVRRANEMEKERERQIDEKMAKKKRRRGCCGVFSALAPRQEQGGFVEKGVGNEKLNGRENEKRR